MLWYYWNSHPIWFLVNHLFPHPHEMNCFSEAEVDVFCVFVYCNGGVYVFSYVYDFYLKFFVLNYFHFLFRFWGDYFRLIDFHFRMRRWRHLPCWIWPMGWLWEGFGRSSARAWFHGRDLNCPHCQLIFGVFLKLQLDQGHSLKINVKKVFSNWQFWPSHIP